MPGKNGCPPKIERLVLFLSEKFNIKIVSISGPNILTKAL